MIASYPKVMNYGNSGTENALVGEVIIQEKVDGSQFRWGFDNDGNFVMGSHNCEMFYPTDNKLFKDAIEYIYRDKNSGMANLFFFAECLCKPKHNTLKYDTIPTNHLMIFDVLRNGAWCPVDELVHWANFWGVDYARELYRGTIENSLEGIKSLSRFLDTDSYLGGTKIEGIVVKNYNQYIQIGTHVWPIFTKYVNPAFREKNDGSHKADRPDLEAFLRSFATEARWNKAIQHLNEQDKLVHGVQDIGPLIQEIHKDIPEEESETIKHYLYRHFIKAILSRATNGFPEWYKAKIINDMYGKKEAADEQA